MILVLYSYILHLSISTNFGKIAESSIPTVFTFFISVQRQIDHRKSVTFQLRRKVHFSRTTLQLLAELFVQSSRIFETTLNTRPIFQSNGHWNLRMQECLIVRNVCSWPKVRNNLKVISASSSIMFWTAFWLLFYRHSCNSDWTRFP